MPRTLWHWPADLWKASRGFLLSIIRWRYWEEPAIGKEVLIIKIKQEVILSIVEAPAVATSLCWSIVQLSGG